MEKYKAQTDEQLIRRMREGEPEIMDFLLMKYKNLVRKKARHIYLLGGEKEDLIQEGMIGLMKAVQNYDESAGSSFFCFAEMCISRQMYSAVEASKRKKHIPLNSYISLYDVNEEQKEDKSIPLIDTIEPQADNNPEAIYFSREYSEDFLEQLERVLSPLENHVLYLHLNGTDYRKIAELLDKSPKTVDNALQRIKKKAGKFLRKE